MTIDNGVVTVDLNMSAEPGLPTSYSSCVDGGMKYHIHMLWTYPNDTDRLGSSACGADYTGGHWDPWHGMSLTLSSCSHFANLNRLIHE